MTEAQDMRVYEAQILKEARRLTGKKTLKASEILHWGAGHIKDGEGEETYFIKSMQVTIVVKSPKPRKKKAKKTAK